MEGPRRSPRVKNFFQKTLILAFEVSVQPLIHTLFIALFFSFFALCGMLLLHVKCYSSVCSSGIVWPQFFLKKTLWQFNNCEKEQKLESFQQWKHSRNVNPWKTATKECEFRSGWSFFIWLDHGWMEGSGDIFGWIIDASIFWAKKWCWHFRSPLHQKSWQGTIIY